MQTKNNATVGPTPAASQVTEYIPLAEKDPIKLSISIVRNLLCVKTKSGKLCDDQQAMRFIMLCRSRKLNPFDGDAFLIGYDTNDGPQFNLITAHQAFLKRAESHPQYDGMESGVIVQARDAVVIDREGDFVFDDEVLLGGWATVFCKDRSHPMKRRLKLATFRKPFGRWKEDPAGMIVKCAEADALRSSFPSMMSGMYLDLEIGTPANQARPLPPAGRQTLRKNGPALLAAAEEPPTEVVPILPPHTPDGEIIHESSESSGQAFPDEPPTQEEMAMQDTVDHINELIDAGQHDEATFELQRHQAMLGGAYVGLVKTLEQAKKRAVAAK